MNTVADLRLRHHDRHATKEIIDDLIDAYAEIYNVPPYAGDPFFSPDTYADRLRAALEMDGFETVTASSGDQLVGYVHGALLPADRSWWDSLGVSRPEAVRVAAEARKVFWLRELMVRPAYTNRGIGRLLHDTVIAGRAEPWTALTCIIGNEPAHGAYLRWGYQLIGQVRHAPESPVYSAMILPPLPNTP